MGTLQLLNSHNLTSLLLFSSPSHFNKSFKSSKCPNQISFCRVKKVRVVGTARSEDTTPEVEVEEDENPQGVVDFAFVHSVLLPDGTPDVHYRRACGGKKLRDIMLDNNLELYGPYSRPLLNCGGGGTCGTCIVEVIEGKELLTPRTDKEKEKLRRKPRNWRLACQTTVGKPDSKGLIVIQQLPEWKAHEWNYGKEPPQEETIYV